MNMDKWHWFYLPWKTWSYFCLSEPSSRGDGAPSRLIWLRSVMTCYPGLKDAVILREADWHMSSSSDVPTEVWHLYSAAIVKNILTGMEPCTSLPYSFFHVIAHTQDAWAWSFSSLLTGTVYLRANQEYQL